MFRTSRFALPLSLLALASTTGAQPYFVGQRLVPGLGSVPGADDAALTLTEDELSMIFASRRPGGVGGMDLYETRRAAIDAPWAPPQLVVGVNTPATETHPHVSRDGLELYFVSNRPGSLGAMDLYVTRRSARNVPWGAVVNLVALNGAAISNGFPYLTDDGLTLFFSSNGLGGSDLFTAQRASRGAPWGAKDRFAPASGAFRERAPIAEHNGHSVLFTSDRPGGRGSFDWYRVHRDANTDLWSAPYPIDELNTTQDDGSGWRSGITGRLYLAQWTPVAIRIFELCLRIEEIEVEFEIPYGLVPVWDPILGMYIYQTEFCTVPGTVNRLTTYDWTGASVSALFVSLGTLPQGIAFPGIDGVLYLDPATTFHVGNVAVPPSGLLEFPIALPAAASGLTLSFQTVSFDLATSTASFSQPMSLMVQ